MFKKFINSFLTQEQFFYQKFVGNYFDREFEKDIRVFEGLHPNNDFERSIAQHKCQVYPLGKDVFMLNLKAFFMIPILMVALLLKKKLLVKGDQSTIVCYNCYNLPGSLPEAFDTDSIAFLKSKECTYYLSMPDISFLIRFFLKSFSCPFLSFRVLLKVAKYRAIIDSFSQLNAIAITGEFIDTSSAMTQYCHERGIKHFNFMQGEAFGSPRQAFFHFDKCFVWDQHYVDMFTALGAPAEQFVVSLPKCLQIIKNDGIEKTIDYTYYLGGDADEELPVIRKALDKLVAKGYLCEVRPHPKWSNMEAVRKEFEGISIQDTSKVNIDHSILQTKNAVSLYSTVLLQAFCNDVHVVIDDLSSPDKFNMLERYQYIMLNKPHRLLSEITKS